MRQINKLILHCSATKEGEFHDVAEIDKWHRQRGFRCIGYHFVIQPDGTVQKGRDESKTGAHCEGQNYDSIGICYVGGLDSKGKPKDTRTNEQKDSLLDLIDILICKYHLNSNAIHVHNEYANKACPCFSREQIINEYNERIK